MANDVEIAARDLVFLRDLFFNRKRTQIRSVYSRQLAACPAVAHRAKEDPFVVVSCRPWLRAERSTELAPRFQSNAQPKRLRLRCCVLSRRSILRSYRASSLCWTNPALRQASALG